MVKRALVLSGGSSRGAYQVGALHALAQHGREWNTVHGISVGALNAAWISMFSPEQQKDNINGLIEVWKSIKSSDDIYQTWSTVKPINYMYSMWKGSLYSGAPLHKLLNKFFHKDSIRTPLTVGCCNLENSEYHVVTEKDPNIFDFVLASSHLPLVFEPININGILYVDGGIRHQIPIIEALKERPDEIDVILTSPISTRDRIPNTTNLRSAPRVALRASEIMSDQVYLSDCYTVLKAIKTLTNVKINLFVPSVCPTSNSMTFNPDEIANAILLGYIETKNKMEKNVCNITKQYLDLI